MMNKVEYKGTGEEREGKSRGNEEAIPSF